MTTPTMQEFLAQVLPQYTDTTGQDPGACIVLFSTTTVEDIDIDNAEAVISEAIAMCVYPLHLPKATALQILHAAVMFTMQVTEGPPPEDGK